MRVRVRPPICFGTLCADPPWPFKDKLPGNGRGMVKHYRPMKVDAICAVQLPLLLDDAVLYLWRVASMQEEALRVVRAWGFVPKSEVVWKKLTRKGNRHFGMGRSVRMEHESCIIATRGKPLRMADNIRSVFEAPVGVHSEKPETFYTDIVERLYPGPYVELFARRSRPGWIVLGDQAPT